MDPDKFSPQKRYYCVLGLSSDASTSAIRHAYKKLAMRWHPDKCASQEWAEAKIKFQEIQEAYSVLCDQNKRLLYDSGLYDPEDDENDVEGFTSFLSEMSGMMADIKAEEAGKVNTFEELQQLFVSMFSADLAALNNQCQPPACPASFDNKRRQGGGHYDVDSFLETCMMEPISPFPQHLFNNTFQCGATKEAKDLQGSCTSGGKPCDYNCFKKS